MKVKRQKHVRKTLLFYRNGFGHRPPYQVLIDGTFCKAALTFKVNISEQLPKYLDAEVRLYTTKCVLAECEYFGEMLYGPLKVLRQFALKPCGHETPHPPIECLRRMVKKNTKDFFFIATQDQLLSEKLRRLPGAPLLYISHNAINLEAPSSTSVEVAEGKVKVAVQPTNHERENLTALKKAKFGEEPVKKKKRRKIKGPNPLSCKKKKKKNPSGGGTAGGGGGVRGRSSEGGGGGDGGGGVDTRSEKRKARSRRRKNKNALIDGTAVNNKTTL